MHRVRILLLASALLVPGTVQAAQDPARPAASERRLSPDQVEAILNDAARKRDPARSVEDALPPAIHGEIGFSVGTGGYRSAFGTAVVPLPGDGVAVVSFGTDRFDRDFRER